VRRGTTPSQTVGPFFSLGLPWPDGPYVVPEGTAAAIRIRGRVLDGAGAPVPDALVETWQADPDGRFDHPDDPRGRAAGFRGFGRCPTRPDGGWELVTLKPGRVPARDGAEQAPHLAVSILARGLLNRVVTRIYFGDEPDANAADPLLSALDERRRATLVAAASEGGYAIDFHLQGDRETAFFRL
jgi:protocatechuate 3,4-dioxygenase, alpha subunit